MTLMATLFTTLVLTSSSVAAASSRSGHSLWTDLSAFEQPSVQCSNGANLKYLSGDALSDSPSCLGPNNTPYPRYGLYNKCYFYSANEKINYNYSYTLFHLSSSAVARQFGNWNGMNSRKGRMSSMPTLPPAVTQSVLMKAYSEANEEVDVHGRHGKHISTGCIYAYLQNYHFTFNTLHLCVQYRQEHYFLLYSTHTNERLI